MNATATATAARSAETLVATAKIRLATTIIQRDEEGRVACRCSANCPSDTWNYFAQGHDARLVSRLIDLVTEGTLTLAEAKQVVQLAGGREELVWKLGNAVATAHAKWLKRQDAKAKRAARKNATAKPATVRAKVGRWEYEGQVVDGKFSYTDRSGQAKVAVNYKLAS